MGWQRARRGWSVEDTWSFDDYLARVIAGGTKELGERKIGYPMELTPERWDEILRTISEGFAAYGDLDIMSPEVVEALKLFGQYFPNLWD
jgi:hypothetical protein